MDSITMWSWTRGCVPHWQPRKLLGTPLILVPPEGGEAKQITRVAGVHAFAVDVASKRVVDSHSSATHSLKVDVCEISRSTKTYCLFMNADPAIRVGLYATKTKY